MTKLSQSKIATGQTMRTLILVLFSAFLLMPVSAKSKKNSDNRVIRQLEQIEKMQATYKNQLQEADSLIVVGDTLLAWTTEAIFQATIKMKEQAKTYTHQKRNLEKTISEVSRQEANDLRTTIRGMDVEYRNALKAYDEFMRQIIRESENGLSSYDKGQEFRKEAEKGLKEIERRMAEIKNSLESNGEEEVNVTMK
jgi:nitrogenase molybdenum-iron protein alpha/beta subunit